MNTDRGPREGSVEAAFARAAALLRAADGLVVAAGAGMGVDSGLPDFRGPEGFWRAYPALRRRGLRFDAIANPAAFAADPVLAWGFYGHRLRLYRATRPHRGFALLREIGERLAHGVFVFTSNVDGQFQAAGFDPARVFEVHGSIHHLQCSEDCRGAIWAADAFDPEVDEDRCRLASPLPRCPHCGALARPNILMFGDAAWAPGRSDAQQARFADWLAGSRRPVVVELGAGTEVATVRRFSDRFAPDVIRVNPVDCVPPAAGGVGIAQGAEDAIARLAAMVADR
jgi:NAD-dependent SIR2 family protein deacetylase